MPPQGRRIKTVLHLELPAGQATPAWPVGPMLSQHQLNIMEFVRQFNAATEAQRGMTARARVTVYDDRSFALAVLTPPTAALLRRAAGIERGRAAGRGTVATITHAQLREIALLKLPDLSAHDVAAAEATVAGTARSMGIAIGSPNGSRT
jgi:large subunit ribosomal protein L11